MQQILAEYDVPMKDGVQRHWVVDWTSSGLNEEQIAASFTKHKKTVDDRADTIVFVTVTEGADQFIYYGM